VHWEVQGFENFQAHVNARLYNLSSNKLADIQSNELIQLKTKISEINANRESKQLDFQIKISDLH
jgi:hypothetical protein